MASTTTTITIPPHLEDPITRMAIQDTTTTLKVRQTMDITISHPAIITLLRQDLLRMYTETLTIQQGTVLMDHHGIPHEGDLANWIKVSEELYFHKSFILYN